MKILVLIGGTSAERDVSLATGKAVMEGLKQAGYEVMALDTARGYELLPNHTQVLSEIKETPPDVKELQKVDEHKTLEAIEGLQDVEVVFLALHGGTGEDGTIQAVLELTGKPYTGSGVLASALAMNKIYSKKIFEREKIPTPEWFIFEQNSDLTSLSKLTLQIRKKFRFPVVVKPSNQGSTVGLSVVKKEKELSQAIKEACQYSQQILIERFIPGREITVSILGDEALPVIEIIPQHQIYDYECKYTTGKSQYTCPADLPVKKTRQVQEIALKAFKALGCEGYGRVDFRYGKDGKFYCLEVNTLPGMTANSLVPKAASASGIDFSKLVDKIVKLALEKKKFSHRPGR